MVAFLTRMPAGISGAITRPLESTIEPGTLYRSTDALGVNFVPKEYGQAVVFDATAKRYRLPNAGDTAADIAGFLTRPYPGGVAQFTGALGVTPVDGDHVVDIMKRGYMSVKLRGATASAKQGLVYVRIATPTTPAPLGGVEAAADAANTVVLDAKTRFMGPAFTDSTFGAETEIAFNI
jgi:hypothetical protein